MTVTAMGLVGYGQLVASRATGEQAQLVPLADQVAQNVATANLYLLQALSGNHKVSVDSDVIGNLHQASSLVAAAIDGGTVAGSHLSPASDPTLKGDLRQLQVVVTSFSALTKTRVNKRHAGHDLRAKLDARSNALFGLMLSATQQLRHDANAQVSRERATISRLNVLVLAMLLLFFGGVALIAKRTRRSIVSKNVELEEGVKERTAELARTQARTEAIVNTSVDSVITIDETGTILSVNPSTLRMFGYEQGEMVGKNVSIIMTREDKLHHNQFIRRYVDSGQAKVLGVGRELAGRRKDGTEFPIEISVSEARVPGEKGVMFVGQIRDITERKAAEAELHAAKEAAEEAATHDPLTGLWNHNRILEILMEEMARSEREGGPLSVAMMDLDHFKQVNDTHGHMVGDEVLREVANRLSAAIRPYDKVGRFGGEEFVVVLPGTRREQARAAAERIRLELSSRPIATSAGPLSITGSLGVASKHGEKIKDTNTMLVAADTALYEAKESGRDQVKVAGSLKEDSAFEPPRDPADARAVPKPQPSEEHEALMADRTPPMAPVGYASPETSNSSYFEDLPDPTEGWPVDVQ